MNIKVFVRMFTDTKVKNPCIILTFYYIDYFVSQFRFTFTSLRYMARNFNKSFPGTSFSKSKFIDMFYLGPEYIF